MMSVLKTNLDPKSDAFAANEKARDYLGRKIIGDIISHLRRIGMSQILSVVPNQESGLTFGD